MTTSLKELKRRARSVLTGKYFLATSLTATVSVFTMLMTYLLQKTGFAASENMLYVSFYWILGGIMLLLISLVNAGLIKFIASLGTKERLASGVLFYAFQHQPDTFILVAAFRYLITLIWFVPAVRKYLTISSITSLTELPEILLPTLTLALLGFIPAILLALPYSQAFYLLVADPDLPALEVLKTSRNLMRGNYFRLLRLYLSFLPWCIISFTSGGLAAFWILPYYYATMCEFHRNLIGADREPDAPDEIRTAAA